MKVYRTDAKARRCELHEYCTIRATTKRKDCRLLRHFFAGKKLLRPIYYVNEDRLGSIYRFMRNDPNNYARGQTFV